MHSFSLTLVPPQLPELSCQQKSTDTYRFVDSYQFHSVPAHLQSRAVKSVAARNYKDINEKNVLVFCWCLVMRHFHASRYCWHQTELVAELACLLIFFFIISLMHYFHEPRRENGYQELGNRSVRCVQLMYHFQNCLV